MRNKVMTGILALTLGVTLLQGAPETASAAGSKTRPAVQSMKSVPVAKVKAKASKVTSGKVAFSPETLPKPAAEPETVDLDEEWSESVDGLSVRAESNDEDTAADVRLAAVGDGVDVPRGPVFEIAPAEAATQPEPSAEPSPSAKAEDPAPEPTSSARASEATPEPSTTNEPQPDAAPADPLPDESQVRLDYSDFADAYGGDWAGRLHLVLLEDCSTETGKLSCASSTPLTSKNDLKKSAITATLPTQKSSTQESSAQTMMVAAAAAPSGPQGDYTASTLTPSSSWSAGSQSGDFTWTYPLTAPPGVNGPEPELSIDYSSGSVDGRTSTSNAQASWVGEGFDLDPGFIERSYEACDLVSGTPANVGDLCWRDDHISISLNGKSSVLVRKGSSNEWRMKSDDGTVVERLTSAGINADNDGEYWRVTTTDGTRYYYGRNERFDTDSRKTDSVSVVPVYGATSGDKCHDSTYASSSCTQAWRWGLDYVVDPNGNTMSVFWDQEKNKYGANKNDTVRSYDRAPLLKSIEYGTRLGNTDPAPARVVFTSAERCIPTSDFDCAADKLTEANASHWPDVPFDQICTSETSCSERTAPTFFSRKRLAKVTTEVRNGDSYAAVNEWVLSHQLPATGDASTDPDSTSREVRSLWLAQIQQTGKAGTDVSLPPVKFGRQLLDNRVYDTNGVDSFARFRVNAIDNGTGGSIAINYSARDCTTSSKPAASALDSNARRCFPVWYQPWWAEPDDRQLEFFHKYRVESISESDNTTTSPISAPKVTTYTYGGGDGWHYTTSTLDKAAFRTWDEWRGYSNVTTAVGQSSAKTYANTLYMRGMHGDRTAGGGTKSVTITDSAGGSADIVDRDQYAGFERRTLTKLGAAGNVVDITTNTPWTSTATASEGAKDAYLVNIGGTEVRTRLADGTYRTTQTTTTFDGRGRPTQVSDAGDTSTATDNRCTTTTYADNAAEGMFDYPATETTIGLSCGTAPTAESHVISATRTAYDGGAVGQAPTKGNPTSVDSAASFAGGAIGFQRDATTTYDAYGRATSVKDAKDRSTTTTYAPATGYPETVTVTNAKNQTAVSYPSRAWGSPSRTTDVAGGHTDYTYDALGRVTAVWGPDRDKATQTPTAKYAYRVSTTAPNAVTTETINASGGYTTSVAFFDGLLRERATQAPSPGVDGGRVMTEKWYDDRGWLAYDHGPYYNAGAVSTTFSTAEEADIPRSTKYTYDTAGRTTVESLTSLGLTKWSTTKGYDGDRIRTSPPTGGTATTEAFDARGQLTGLTQHTAATATGTGDVTTYTYTPAGQLKTVKNAAGSTWTKTYDIRGRLVKDEDPDKGTSVFTYDATDQQVTSTDARGVKLWTGYDVLDRKVELRDDSATGTKRSAWTYDSPRAGALGSSTRYVGDDAYTTEINSYDAAGRVTKSTLRLPTTETELYRAAGYPTTTTYNPDGSPQQVAQPLVSDLTNESLRYTYDDLGNVKTLKGYVTFVSDTIYSPLGEVLQRTSGNVSGKSVYDSRYYDDATRRIQRREVSRQGTATTPIIDLRYTQDQAGNVTRLDDVATGDAAMGGHQWRQCFTYDHLRRMTKAWSTSSTNCSAPTSTTLGTIAPYSDVYTLSANGNRTRVVSMRKQSSTVTTTTRTSTFPAVTAARPHAVTSVASSGSTTGSEAFTYDAAGNLTKRSTSTTAGKVYDWDREGRVKSISDLATASKKIEYLYDADGNRLIERDSTGTTPTLTLNVGASQIKVNVGSTPVSNTTTTRTYTIGDEAVATRTAAGVRLMATDHQGTPLVTVNPNDLTYVKRRLSPFGEQLQAPASAWPSNKGFLNKTTDTWAGTSHLEAREYDPRDGRFISVDPVGDPRDPQSLNGYAYAHNSPVTNSDPSGLYIPCDGTSCPGGSGTVWQPKNKSYMKAYHRNTSYNRQSARQWRADQAWSSASRPAVYSLTPHRWAKVDATRGSKSGAELLKGVARIALFDERECVGSGATGGGCAAQIAMAVPVFKIAKLGKLASVAEKGEDGMAAVREAGRAGEEAAGIVKNTRRIPSASGAAKYRIPDELNGSVLGEVKNTARLGYSKQLQDFAAYASDEGLTFRLYVRGSTRFSKQLQREVDAGRIVRIDKLP